MKKTFRLLAFSFVSAALMSCENEALPVIDNMIYINGADAGRVGTIDMATEGDTELQFTVRLAKAVDHDVTVSIAIDPQVIEDYNERYQGGYKPVEKSNIKAPVLTTIPAGSVNSNPVVVKVSPFETGGAKYAIGVKVSSTGDIPVAEETSKFIFYMMKPLHQMVPMWKKDCAAQCLPYTDWGMELLNCTLEWWCRLVPYYENRPFYTNNQCLIHCTSSRDNNGMYVRFGDLVYGSYDFNYLQVKTMGGQFDTGNPADGKGLSANTWYHFAVSYDGTTGESKLYQDGQLVAVFSSMAGVPMYIDAVRLAQNMSYDYVEMCQLRLWKTTRTEAQISNNMRSEVEYTDKDLVMYLPMNEGPGAKVINDVANDDENETHHSATFGVIPSLAGDAGGTDEAHGWNEYAF